MTMTDPIADLLTRVRNAINANKSHVDVPASNIKRRIVSLMLDQGFINKYVNIRDSKQGLIRIYLKYDEYGNSAISGLKRISKPGVRVYKGVKDMPRVRNNFGVAIMSTSKGVMTNKVAKKLAVGGEILCYVW